MNHQPCEARHLRRRNMREARERHRQENRILIQAANEKIERGSSCEGLKSEAINVLYARRVGRKSLEKIEQDPIRFI